MLDWYELAGIEYRQRRQRAWTRSQTLCLALYPLGVAVGLLLSRVSASDSLDSSLGIALGGATASLLICIYTGAELRDSRDHRQAARDPLAYGIWAEGGMAAVNAQTAWLLLTEPVLDGDDRFLVIHNRWLAEASCDERERCAYHDLLEEYHGSCGELLETIRLLEA